MRFVYFTRTSGNEVYVNLDHVTRFVYESDFTRVYLTDGGTESIKESPAEIATRIEETR